MYSCPGPHLLSANVQPEKNRTIHTGSMNTKEELITLLRKEMLEGCDLWVIFFLDNYLYFPFILW